jgi:hypothetical protein
MQCGFKVTEGLAPGDPLKAEGPYTSYQHVHSCFASLKVHQGHFNPSSGEWPTCIAPVRVSESLKLWGRLRILR